MEKFVILGEVVSKKNNKRILYKGSGKYKTPFIASSERYVAWNKQAKEQLVLQRNLKHDFYTECCKMVITFYYGTYRDKDADNGISSVFDTLTDTGIIKDDNWHVIRQHFVFSEYDKINPRVEVEIYDCNESMNLDDRINSVKNIQQQDLEFD